MLHFESKKSNRMLVEAIICKSPKPASHFKTLKTEANHLMVLFNLDELRVLMGEDVIYLPEMGKIITMSNQTCTWYLPIRFFRLVSCES